MRRREFIGLLGTLSGAWPLRVVAQQRILPIIGVLNSSFPAALGKLLMAFRVGLRDVGYEDGRNVKLEYRWAEGRYDRIPALAAELVQKQVAVIMAIGDSAWAAKEATTTIPIVFANGSDPIEAGLVESLDRPRGNVTGVSWTSNPLFPKRLELLHDLIPQISTVGALVNPRNPSAEIDVAAMQHAAELIGLQMELHNASTFEEITDVFSTMAQHKLNAVVVGADSFFVSQQKNIVALAARYALPTSYPIREYVAAGGLMSYAPNREESLHVAGMYVGRILKGEKTSELPVQLPTKFELAINLKTAQTLGLTIPQTLLAVADEVIE